FAFIRERAGQRWKEERVSAARVVAAGTLLDPNALTIGFARRFTGYKRPELGFHNPERLKNILNAARRPGHTVSPPPLPRRKAAGAGVPQPRAAQEHPQRRAAAGADRLRRQGAPGRRDR